MSAADPADPLAEPCPTCAEPIGDHLFRDWIAHTDSGLHEFPHQDMPVSWSQLRPGAVFADTIDTRSAVTDTALGRLGLVEMHWQQGNPTAPARSMATVVFMGPPALLRKAGKLLNQAMHRAANVAEGKP